MKKKLFALILAVTLTIPMLVPFSAVNARTVITNPSAVTGSRYTSNQNLAAVLTAIFNGDIDLYKNSSCTNEFNLPIGKSLNTSTGYYIKNKTTGVVIQGWSCFVYANAVYNRLFNEPVRRADVLVNSEIVIKGGGRSISYSQFASAGIRCGAYIRTTGNSNGSYSSDVAHSMIVLSYDQTNITYLEGNADGKGLARITSRTWSEFNYTEFTKKNRYLCHVVQPTAEKFAEFYPSEPHDHEYTLIFEDQHPHKECQYCTCGDRVYTGVTQAVDLCIECYPPSTTNPNDYPMPTRTLKYSTTADLMKGTDVAWVQAILYQLGYSISVDGIYGAGSASVVTSFQSAQGLEADGICGAATRATLLETWEAKQHEHTLTDGVEAEHPHRKYKACECGYTEYDDTANPVESCVLCFPVGTPVASVSSSEAHPEAKVSISWEAVENAKEYNVKYVDRSNQEHLIQTTTETKAEISFEAEGKYTVFVESVGVNGDTKTSNEITLKVAHTYDNTEDLFCNECGFERPPYTPGNLDDKEGVDMDDAIYLLFYTFYEDDYPLNQPCDFDNDGDTDIDDAIYLLFHTFYGEDYPLN